MKRYKSLQSILKTKLRPLNAKCRSGNTYAFVNAHKNNSIFYYKKMIRSAGVLEEVLVHEWFHHYQYQIHGRAKYDKMEKMPAMLASDQWYASANLLEEEAEAFCLFGREQDQDSLYDLDDIHVKLWLYNMWEILYENYPGLREHLITVYPTGLKHTKGLSYYGYTTLSGQGCVGL